MTTPIEVAIQKIQSEAAARVAELQAEQNAYETKVAALAESETQRARRERQERERSSILAAMDAKRAELDQEFDDYASELDTWRAASLAAIEAVKAIGAQQDQHVRKAERLVEHFTLMMRPYRPGFDSDQEFHLFLWQTIEQLTSKLSWNLGLDVHNRKNFGISERTWVPPMGLDVRKAALNKALKATIPPAPEPLATVATPPATVESETTGPATDADEPAIQNVYQPLRRAAKHGRK